MSFLYYACPTILAITAFTAYKIYNKKEEILKIISIFRGAINVKDNRKFIYINMYPSIEDDFYQVVEMESKYWFTNLITNQSPLFTGTLKHELNMNTESLTNFFYLYRP